MKLLKLMATCLLVGSHFLPLSAQIFSGGFRSNFGVDADILANIKSFFYRFNARLISRISLVFFIKTFMCLGKGHAQVETFSSGSYIVNMGIAPQTVGNALKPYGLIYDLIKNNNVPVKLVVGQSKVKDGIDFTYNNVQYKGGTYIIPKEFINSSVSTKISSWNTQGVVGSYTNSDLTLDVTQTYTAAPNWTLDDQNGRLAISYFVNAGIPSTAYGFKAPSFLSSCDDIYVMPHADPTWPTHGNLLPWNNAQKGAIWAGCHAVSVLENLVNPSNSAEKMNFLSTNGLVPFGSHAAATPPYINQNFTNPTYQYIGKTDLAHLNGSEQVYLPTAGSAWRPGTSIIGTYDPTQANVPSISPGEAAINVYGRAFGDSNRGMVCYQAGHVLSKATLPDNIAAQRVFFNWSFLASLDKKIFVSFSNIPSRMTVGTTYTNLKATASGVASNFTYQWSSIPGGNFSAPNASMTNFTPSVTGFHIIQCIVTDPCGRTTLEYSPLEVVPAPTAPVVVNDNASIASDCGTTAESISLNVLTNDTDINLDTLYLTGLSSTSGGTWIFSENGLVTYTPAPNFNGTATASYTVCDNKESSLRRCSNGSITIVVGTTDADGCYPGTVRGIQSSVYPTAQTNTGITNPANALNDPDYDSSDNTSYAVIDNNSDSLTLDFGSLISSGDSVTLYIASETQNSSITISIEYSTNNSTFLSLGTFSTSSNEGDSKSFLRPAGGFMYLKIKRTSGSVKVFIDAASVDTYGCLPTLILAKNDFVLDKEDIAKVINILGNDDNPLERPLTLSILTSPVNGYVSINLDNTITYLNKKDFSGTDSLTYQICDDKNICSSAKVYFTIQVDGCSAGLYKPLSDAVTSITIGTTNSTTVVADAMIRSDRATENKGSETTMKLGKKDKKRIVMKFDLTAIPVGSEIENASLELFPTSSVASSLSLSVHKLLVPFVEGQTTWNISATSTPWTPTPGGTFSPVAIAQGTFMATDGVKHSWDIADLVQDWLTNGNNNGLILRQSNTVDKEFTYGSSENGTSADLPRLVVGYKTSGACVTIPNRAPLAFPDLTTTTSSQPVTINTLANDNDADASTTLSITQIVSVTGGSAVISAGNQQITFTPNSTFTGKAKVVYRVSDGTLTDDAVITITVKNSAPTANHDIVSVNSNANISINVQNNDSDTDGPGSLTTKILTTTKNGSVSLTGSTVLYTPSTNFTGKDTLYYSICESVGGCETPLCDTSYVAFTVVNQKPVAVNDIITTNPCLPITFIPTNNDTDPETGVLTAQIVTGPSNGTVVLTSDGLKYTPNTGFSGSDSYTYKVCDNGVPEVCSDPATVSINVNSTPVNRPPVALNDEDSTLQNQDLYIDVLLNDSDIDDNELNLYLSADNIIKTKNGTASIFNNTLIKYIPDPNFQGLDTIDYFIFDKTGSSGSCVLAKPDTVSAKIFIEVNPCNAVTVGSNSPTVCLNSAISITHTTYNVTAIINTANGLPTGVTASWNNNILSISGVPTQTGTFNYDISLSGYCNTVHATGTIIVSDCSIRNFPDPDVNITYVNIPVTGSVSTNDDVPSGSTYGTPVPKSTNPPSGVLTLQSNGTYTFTSPNPGIYYYEVPVCPFGQSSGCPTTLLKIDVLPVDPAILVPPVANHDVAYTKLNTAVTLKTLLNDRSMQSGISLDTMTIDTIAGLGSRNGTVTFNSSTGDITFNPTTGFTGIEIYYYKVCDKQSPALCDTATQTIYVLSTATPPNTTQASDDYNTTLSGVAVTGNVKTNDYDPEGHATTVTALDSTITGKGRLVLLTDGTYTFTPVAGFSGPVSYPYIICDNQTPKACAKATLYILVVPFVADPDINITYVNVLVTGSVATNDDVPPGSTYGTPIPKSTNPPAGVLTLQSDGTYTFTSPNPGTYYYDVPVCPIGQSSGCPTTLLKIEVLPLDTLTKAPPIANHDLAYTKINTAVTLKTFLNDTTMQVGAILNRSTLDTIAGLGSRNGTVVFNRTTGDITFTPTTGFTGIEIYYYKICDNQNPALCDTATQTIYVLPSAPPNTTQASDDYNTTISGVAVTGNVKTNDFDPDPLQTTVVTALDSTIAGKGRLVLLTDGSYTFTPVPGFVGPVSYPYTICDNGTPMACAKATLYILVKPFVADPDVNITYVNIPVTGSVSTNDDVPPGTTYGTPVPKSTNPPSGVLTLNPNGTYTFTSPNPGTYYYEVPVCPFGQSAGCPLTLLKIDVLPVDPTILVPPVANHDVAYTKLNTAVTLKTLLNDRSMQSGISLDTMTIDTIAGLGSRNGTVTFNSSTGDITFNPTTGFTGIEVYYYKVCDKQSPALCDTATQTIYVLSTATPPNTSQASDDYNTTLSGVAVTGNVKTNDYDPEGHATTVTALDSTIAGKGRLVLLTDGTYTFTPVAGFSGPVSYPYIICDNQTPKACAKATLYILVVPVIITITYPDPDVNITYVNTQISGSVATNDEVPSGTTYGTPVPKSTNPPAGVLNLNPDGTYTFKSPNPGTYYYEVPVCSPGQSSGCPVTLLKIDVLPLDTTIKIPPIANHDVAYTQLNTSVTLKTFLNDRAMQPGFNLAGASLDTIAGLGSRNGTVAFNRTSGDITYTPATGFSGVETYQYKICDDQSPALCDTATQTIYVLPSTPPNSTQASDDYNTTFSGNPITGNVKTNDYDPEGHSTTVTPQTTTVAGKGTLNLLTDGSYTFTSVPGFYGPVSFPYTICDNQNPAACAVATLYILVKPFLPDPDVNITYVNIPVTGSVATNDDVPPGTTYGNPLPRSTNPPGGILTLNPNGTYTFRSENPGVYYYEVEVCLPGQTSGCPTRTLKITVLQVGEFEVNPPIAQIDIAYTLVNIPVVLRTTANDTTGTTGRSLDRNSISIVSGPSNGSVTNISASTGDITYIPNANFVGIDRYTYRICDNGTPTALCDTAIQEIYIFDTSIPNSTQAADDYYTTYGGTKVTGSVVNNDIDPEGHPTLVTPQTTDIPGVGKLTLLSSGAFEFEPDGNFSGPVSFIYEICDNQNPKACAKATLYLLVKPIPKPAPDYNLTYVNIKIEEMDGNVFTNDILPVTFFPMYYLKGAIPGNPSDSLPRFNARKDGAYSFTAAIKGLYEFDVYVCPSTVVIPSDVCLVSRLTINVLDFESPLNPPTALPDFATTRKNVPVTLKSLTNDAAGNSGGQLDTSSVLIITNGKYGSGSVVSSTGDIIYTPSNNFVGYDTLTYRVCEQNQPTLCDTTYQIIEIVPVSDPNFVQANDDYVNTFANRPVSGNVITNDFDPEGNNLTVNDSTYTWANKGTIVLNTNGSFVFTPVKSFYGLLTFNYDLCDNGTPQACTKATLYILVKPVSLPSPDINATYVNKSLFGDVSTNDRFIPGTVYRLLSALPGNPSSTLPVMDNKGYYTFLSSLPGTFLYTVELCPPFASGLGCEITQLKIDVLTLGDNSLNKPVAHTDITMTVFNTPVTIPTLSNDKSGIVNGILDSANVKVVIQPDSGTVTSILSNGNIVYAPNSTFFGNDTITYRVCEKNIPTLCATAIQVITVLEPNAANNTSAADDYYTTKQGVPVSGVILDNDTDPENNNKGVANNSLAAPITLADQLSWKVSLRALIKILDTTVLSVGRFEIYNDGTFNFTPLPTFFGPYNLPYQQCDNGTPVACARATIYILVNPSVTIPSGPVACIEDVNVSLNQNCQQFITPEMVLLGTVGSDLTVKINDANPVNGSILDGVSPAVLGWSYAVYKSNGDLVCMGRIHATDNSAPEVTKPNNVTLICDAIDKVLNVPASWENSTYQFFTGKPTNIYDNCGGPLSLKVTDALSYFNCAVDGVYARILRSFRYADQYGNDSIVTQEISFKRPVFSTVSASVINNVSLGNFGPLGANTKYTTINGQVDQNATVVTTYARNRRDTLVFNSCAAPTSSTEIRSYLRDAYKYVYLIDTSTYRRDTAYLFDDLCNYQVSFTYNTFPGCNNGSHIQALVSIMDGCTNAILVDTLSLIFQDTIAPQFMANSTQLNGIRGSLENAPVQMNASTESCSGSIRLPSNAGMNGWILSSHFNVKVSDNCNGNNVLFSYKLETKNHWAGYYVPRTTWVEDGYVAMPMPDQSIVYNNLPIGEHRLIVSAFDQCANTGLDTFYFNLVDNTPPVMACKDKLNVSITSNSSDNWYLNGRYAKSLYPGEGEKSAGRVYVSDINEGSRDNCRLDSLYVRRMFTSSCLDFLKTNLIYDRFGLNPDGVVDLSDFEPVNGKPDTYWTPRGMPYIEIFCCDLSAGNKEIMVELWGRDGGALPFASSQSAWSHCWSVINIEDKSAPVITKVDYTMSGNAGKKNWMYCTDKEAIKAVQQEDLSVLRFGFPSIFGLECNGKVTYSSREKLHCDTGLIYRTWVVEKEIKPGMVVKVTFTDSIFVLADHSYTISVPADVVTDCADQKGAAIPGVTFNENGCDLLAISISPDRIFDRDAKGTNCATIYRTSTVINWCQVPNQFQCSNAADPMMFATVLPRNSTANAITYEINKRAASPALVLTQFVNGPVNIKQKGTTANIFNDLLKLNPGCNGFLGEQSFAWQYTQIISVRDTIAPLIGQNYQAPDFGVSAAQQCLANGKITFKVADNCTSSPLVLEKAFVVEKGGNISVGKVMNTFPMFSKDSFEVSVSDLTAGSFAPSNYQLLVTVKDGCGLASTKRLPFTVSVKAAPALVCVQTLTTSLMKMDTNVQASQRIRAIDFFQDTDRNWSLGACSPVVAVGITRNMNASFSADSSVEVTCNDIGVIPVKVFLKDAYGNISFCSTFINVEDNQSLCPASSNLYSSITGAIKTANKLAVPNVALSLSGPVEKYQVANANGIYSFQDLQNGFDYTIKPFLDKDHLNGVSTYDLILITKHILGLRPLESPYQLIAADINRSGSISTLDLIQLRKLILNVTDRFPNNTSWRFVRDGFNFTNPLNPWASVIPEIANINNLNTNSFRNFVGIKIGDVSGNVNPSGAQTSIIRREEKAVPLNVVVKPMENGQFQCTFFIPETEMPDGFQFTLQWAKGLTLVEILPDLLESQNIGQFSEENMLTFSWNGDKKSGKLFTLTFNSSEDNWNKENFLLSNRLTPTEAYKGESVVTMKLNYPVMTDIHAAALLQNYPNPFQQETFVPFYVPTDGEVVIEITNVNATVVKYVKGVYSKGFHNLKVHKNELKVTGVYLVSMRYNNQLFHNKIMFIND